MANQLKIEAWDNLNNLSTKEYSLFRNQSSVFNIDRVYNFPNPFSNDTHFTFFSNHNAKITLSIFTLNGLEIFYRDNIEIRRNELVLFTGMVRTNNQNKYLMEHIFIIFQEIL